MISLDQVLLLQQKVETAVEKIKTLKSEISQLESENDALRRKCAELTNSLEDKTGLVSSLEAEQNQIEETILKALDQLDAVEDAVLSAPLETEGETPASAPQMESIPSSAEATVFSSETDAPAVTETPVENVEPGENVEPEENAQTAEGESSVPAETSSESSINGQFDIF
ncbi:MAG TPA: hypothetical protein DCZ74_07100 [Treponema sp.]|nr:hypothetical protein [Treponema sp.]